MGFLVAALPIIAGIGAGVAQGAGVLGGATGLAASLSTAGLAATAIGGVTSAIGAEESASAQGAAASYQSQVAQNNQQIAQQNAQLASAAGDAREEQQGLKTRAEVGQIEAAQGASNISVNQGSAVDVRSSAASLGELDALTIRSQAQQQALGFENQATSFAGQAGLSQFESSQAGVAGNIAAGGSLLSAASGVANQYLGWQRVGGPGAASSSVYGALSTNQQLSSNNSPQLN